MSGSKTDGGEPAPRPDGNLVVVAIRIMAIYIGLFSITSLIQYVPQIVLAFRLPQTADPLGYQPIWSPVVSETVYLVLAFVAWRHAPLVSSFVTSGSRYRPPVPSGSIEAIQIAAFSVLGIYFLASGLADTAKHAAEYIQIRQVEEQRYFPWSRWVPEMVRAAIFLAVGLFLVFGSRLSVRFIDRLRRLGNQR